MDLGRGGCDPSLVRRYANDRRTVRGGDPFGVGPGRWTKRRAGSNESRWTLGAKGHRAGPGERREEECRRLAVRGGERLPEKARAQVEAAAEPRAGGHLRP